MIVVTMVTLVLVSWAALWIGVHPAVADCSATAAQISNRAASERFAGADRQAIIDYQDAIRMWERCRVTTAAGTAAWMDDTMRKVDDEVALVFDLRSTGAPAASLSYAKDAESLTLDLCPYGAQMNTAESVWMHMIAPYYYQSLTNHFAQLRDPHLDRCLSPASH